MSADYLKYVTPNIVMPRHLEQQALDVIGRTEDFQVKFSGGKYSKNFQTHILPESVKQWIKENMPITANSYDTGFRVHIIHPGLRLHSDYGRAWGLNYILDAGGPNSESVWFDDTKRNKLYGEIIPERTWHLFNTSAQHTVHNMDPYRVRIGITITVEKRQMPNDLIIID